jgi:predicted NUDIX family phosphoesterase
MDCLEDEDDVYNLQKCNVDEEVEADVQINDEDIKGDITLHGCNINDDPNPMAERGEETLQGMKDGDDVNNVQRCNKDEDIREYVHVNDTDVKDDKTVHGCDINHDPKPMAKIGEETFQGCDYDNDIQILESWNEDQSNVGGNAAGKLVESVVAQENETKYGAVNESEQIQH